MKLLPNKLHLNLITGTLYEFTNYLEVIEVQDSKSVILPPYLHVQAQFFYLISLFLCIKAIIKTYKILAMV